MNQAGEKPHFDVWRWLPVLASLLILVSLSAYYYWSEELDADAYQAERRLLDHLEYLDHRLGRAVLEARQSDYHNYDEVVGVAREMREGLRSLGESLQDEFGERPKMAKLYEAIKKEAERKLEVLEGFKSVNALLKNSLHYLPKQAELLRDAVAADGSAAPEILDNLQRIMRATLILTVTQDTAYLGEIEWARVALLISAMESSEEVRHQIDRLLRHVGLVLEQRRTVNQYVDLVLADELQGLAGQLKVEHGRGALAQQQSMLYSRFVFFVLAVALSVYLTHVIRRLHMQSVSLGRTLNELNYQKFALDQHAVVSITDVHGRISYVNDRFTDLSGYPRAELLGNTHRVVRSGSHSKEYYAQLWHTIRGGRVWKGELCNRRKSGELYWVDATIVPFLDETGEPEQYVAIHSDITNRHLAEEALYAEKEFAHTTLRSIADGIVTTDMEGQVTYMNPVAEALCGRTQADSMGEYLVDVVRLVTETDGSMLTGLLLEQCFNGVEREEDTESMPLIISPDGDSTPVKVSTSMLQNAQGELSGAVIVLHDMGEERHLRRKLMHQATHDSLTQLANRRSFEERLAEVIHQAHVDQVSSVLLYLDLDQFKLVNDTCGHFAGDELLKQVSMLLREQLRDTDMLARLGGDEFGVLLPFASPEDGLRVADKLIQALEELRFSWNDQMFTVGASIGLVPMDEETEAASTAMADADMACYAAKEKGRNRVQVYERQGLEARQRRGEMRWVSRISKALEDDRFELFAQAIVGIGQPRNAPIRHYEVLIRMRDEDGEMVPPGAFIPAAERYDLMPTLDRWVIQTLFRRYSSYLREDATGSNRRVQFSINLSGNSMNDARMLEFILDQFTLYPDVPPEDICFEVTETATVGHLRHATEFIRRVKAKGCSFSLDDFGSGLSSFQYLKNLPVDHLKIDGAFVRDMVNEPLDRAMIKAIAQVAHAMGLSTIAEWVENEETREALIGLGVDYLQGYGIHKPEPLRAVLRRSRVAALKVVS